jgi:hypothetical protein
LYCEKIVSARDTDHTDARPFWCCRISGGGGAGGGWDSIFENDQSAKVLDVEQALKLYQYSTAITGAEWPELKAVTSPCPTLNVIGFVTKGMVQREELKRMREMGRPGMGVDLPVKAKVTKVKKTVLVADKVVGGVLKNTVGRVARFVGKRLLGEFPEEAVTGSFQPVASGATKSVVPTLTAPLNELEKDQVLLDARVAKKVTLFEASPERVVDVEDEALFQKIFDEETAPTTNEKIQVKA